MKLNRHIRFAFVLLFMITNVIALAQKDSLDLRVENLEPVDSVEVIAERFNLRDNSKFRVDGVNVQFDMVGLAQMLLSDYGIVQGGVQLNLMNKYLPTFEIGIATADTHDDNTHIGYSTTAPFFRAGLDINLLKDKTQENIFFAGLRYGFATFDYDYSLPSLTDPVWGINLADDIAKTHCTAGWLEITAGVEVKLYKNFRMGWSARYKKQLHSSSNQYSKPYYIPGYGTTTSSTVWSLTYNLIFNIDFHKHDNKRL